MRLPFALITLSMATACGAGDDGFFTWVERRVRTEPYVLDDVPRGRLASDELDCDRDVLERYQGEHLRYERPVNVHPAFMERLERFERVARDLALERYGRAPQRVLHVGAFACRTVRGRAERLSEHALGNAFDLTGFTFGRWRPSDAEAAEDATGAARDATGAAGDATGATEDATGPTVQPREPPASLRRPFRVTIRQHWDTDAEDEQVHRDFVRALARELEDERIFRSMIGPSQPGHAGHLHLGMPPWRYIRL